MYLFPIVHTTKKQRLCIPYLGSKHKIADKIFAEIFKRHPDTEYFYDLFGGGGAAAFYAHRIPQIKQVYYNDLNAGLVDLIRFLLRWYAGDNQVEERWDEGTLPKSFYNWVSRADFFKNHKRQDYNGGMIAACWSFGNGQNTYIFGKDIEDFKRLAHEAVVWRDWTSFNELQDVLNIKLPMEILTLPTVNERRMAYVLFVAKRLKGKEHIESITRLQALESIEKLEQISGDERLVITNLSYRDVPVIDRANTVIYCDIPYNVPAGKKYENSIAAFDRNDFYEWAMRQKMPVYISEYAMPKPFIEVGAWETFSTLNQRRVPRVEKLFWNGK